MKLRVFNLLVQNPQYFLQCVYAWRHFMSFIPVLLRPPFFFQSFGCTHRGSPKDLQKSRSLQTKSNKLRLMNAILIQQSFLFLFYEILAIGKLYVLVRTFSILPFLKMIPTLIPTPTSWWLRSHANDEQYYQEPHCLID